MNVSLKVLKHQGGFITWELQQNAKVIGEITIRGGVFPKIMEAKLPSVQDSGRKCLEVVKARYGVSPSIGPELSSKFWTQMRAEGLIN